MGATHFGPYRLDTILSRGTAATVYRARDTSHHDRVVALKVFDQAPSADPAFRARFRRDAGLLSAVREPHVVPIHRHGEIDGRLYLDLRLVRGPRLADVLRDGPLAPPRAEAIAGQIGAAMESLRRSGLGDRPIDRALAATGIDNGIVRRWDLSRRSLLGEHPLPEAADFAPDLSTAVIDGRLCLVAQVVNLTQAWDFVPGEPVLRTAATGEIAVLDGATVLVRTTERLEVLDLHTGAVVRAHDIGGGARVSTLAVLDGRPVLACEGDRGAIVIRDVDSGRQLGAPMTGHEAALTALGVADLNGRPILVSGARDNAIRVWDLAVRAAG